MTFYFVFLFTEDNCVKTIGNDGYFRRRYKSNTENLMWKYVCLHAHTYLHIVIKHLDLQGLHK